MLKVLRQSTASQSVKLGPFLDDTDGKTPETALTIANTDIKISKAGGAYGNKNSGGGTHDVNGEYTITFDATDTATVGSLKVSCVVAGALPVWGEWRVVEEAVYDALFDAASAGYSTLDAAGIRAALGLATANLDTQLGDVPTLAEMTAAFTEIKGATWATTDTLEAIRDRGDAAWTTAVGFSTHSAADVWAVGARTLTANTNFNDPTAAAIATEILDRALAGHVTAGTVGKALTDIEADTNELQTNQGNWLTATGFSTHSAADVWAVGARTLTANTNLNDPTAAAIATELLDRALAGHSTAGTVGKALIDIEADTNELQGNQGNWLTATGFSTLTAGDVNAQMLDVLTTDTFAEPGQGNPGATISLADKLGYLYKWTRNKKDNNGTVTNYYADDGVTIDQKATTSASGGTSTVEEIVTGA